MLTKDLKIVNLPCQGFPFAAYFVNVIKTNNISTRRRESARLVAQERFLANVPRPLAAVENANLNAQRDELTAARAGPIVNHMSSQGLATIGLLLFDGRA